MWYIQKNHAIAVLLSYKCILYFFYGLTLAKDLKAFELMLGTCLVAEKVENLRKMPLSKNQQSNVRHLSEIYNY